MWDLINSENISEIVVMDLFDGVETDLKKSLKLIQKKNFSLFLSSSWHSRFNDV